MCRKAISPLHISSRSAAGRTSLNKISFVFSNSQVDEIYDRARSAGAIGGKLTGAGGGGFMLLFVPPAKQKKVKETFSNLIHVPFRFESSGSQIIFFNPEENYAAEAQARPTQPIGAFQELTQLQQEERRIAV